MGFTTTNIRYRRISIVKNRAELAALEMKEEKSRLISAGVWGAIFVFSSFMAVIAIMCTILFLFWEQRLYVAIGVWLFVSLVQ